MMTSRQNTTLDHTKSRIMMGRDDDVKNEYHGFDENDDDGDDDDDDDGDDGKDHPLLLSLVVLVPCLLLRRLLRSLWLFLVALSDDTGKVLVFVLVVFIVVVA